MTLNPHLFKLGRSRSIPLLYCFVDFLRMISQTHALLAAVLLAFACGSILAQEKDEWHPDLTYTEIVKRAQARSPYFQGLLGIYLRAGEEGIAVDLQLAKQWSKVAAQKHPFGLYNLANLAMHDGNIDLATEYYQDAALRLERTASRGDPVALFCMGEIDFQLIPTNVPRAVENFRKSAEKGFPLAQATLGSLCLKGLEIRGHDVTKGIELLSSAARKRSLSARFNLGMAYYNGDGVPRDMRKAARWFQLAVRQNFSEAQYTLGVLMLEGEEGLPKNFDEGMRLIKLAANQGHLGAKDELHKRVDAPTANTVRNDTDTIKVQEAKKYYTGTGVPQDYRRAFALFSPLAQKGNAAAARYLGLMLLTGRGCEKNIAQAKQWLERSSSKGDAEATRILSQYSALFR